MAEPTIEELMNLLEDSFLPEKAGSTRADVFMHLTGEKGSDWTVRIAERTCRVQKEKAEKPDLTLEASAQDILDLFMGRLDPLRAFFSGRLKLKGDQGLAFRLTSFFKIPEGRE